MRMRADVADPKMKLIRDKTRATSRLEIDTRIFFSQPLSLSQLYFRSHKVVDAPMGF